MHIKHAINTYLCFDWPNPGSTTANQIVCPIGLHCPEGADEARSCAAGFFTNRTAQWQCEICPDG